MKLKTELYDVLMDAIENGIDDPQKLTYAINDVCEYVLMPIIKYCEDHSGLALQCGSEWLYQSDEAQEGALELVGRILDKLEDYAEDENGEN